MSEKDILASNDIYIFVGVAEMDDKKKLYPKTNILTKNVNEQHENMKMLADVDIDVDEHQIKDGYRYERSKKSEIGGFVMQYFLSDIFGNDTSNEEWEDFDPREIHKNDIEDSKIFTSDLDAFDMSTTDFNNGKKAFIGAWESDWYSSGKLIQNPNSNWVAHSVVTKRKFSHEWYFFDSDDLNDWFPNVNNTESFSNNKCMFKLKRKQ